ncbi:MAG TPA: 3D domain-containing protein [Candidatus Elarobacter sp.]|nr:3D domain-containing protein [Candidatus Elarobacter sp.]
MLSLGLLIPFGAGTSADRVAKAVAAFADAGPAKHVTLVHDGLTETIETRAETADALLSERNLFRAPEDALNVDPASPIYEGEKIVYRAAVPVTLVIDGEPHVVRSAATDVATLLDQQGVAIDRHDNVHPSASTAIENNVVVSVQHVNAWTQVIHRKIASKVVKRFAFTLPPGQTRVVDRGAPGIYETAYAFTRSPDRRAVRRTTLVSRVLRAPRERIVAEGIGEYTALSQIAGRGIDGTLKLASAALSMIATAYTAGCSGCSGITATGRPAGHGIVAVDPRVIPLGTRMYIPGYGPAIAGDTGGAIRGRRIDLGFNSNRQAFQFGRRSVTVYLIK